MTHYKAEGFHNVTAYIVGDNVAEMIAFYSKALGAVERFRLPNPDGGIGHAEIQIGDSVVMLGEPCEGWGGKSSKTLGGSPVQFYVYVEDVEAAMETAKANGMTGEDVQEMFWGDKMVALNDPFGHQWTLAQHVKDVSPEEAAKAWQEICAAS